MTVHLRPRRRCRGLESPASRKSSCHGAGYQGMDKSFLNIRFSSTNLFLFKKGCKILVFFQILDFYLRGSSAIHTLLAFFLCNLGGSSSLYSARQGTLPAGTSCKPTRALLLLHNLVLLQSGWFPALRISHSHQNSSLRDKGMLPRLSNFLHSWLRVRRWPAPLCCSNDSNKQSPNH